MFIAEKLDEERLGGSRAISYELTVPRNQEIAGLTAMSHQGQWQRASGGKITVPDRKAPHKITLVAITKELLAGSFVREIPE